MKRFEGRGSDRAIMIHVQCDGIKQSQQHIERTAPQIGSTRRTSRIGNRSGVYN